MPIIEEVVSRIEDWKGRNISIHHVGGLTNTNYKVLVDGTPFFVRVPGESTELLAIDRQNEYFNTQQLQSLELVHTLIIIYLNCRLWSWNISRARPCLMQLLNAAGMPTKIAMAIKRLHGGPRFLSEFNMFRLTEYYLGICKKHNIPIPEGYSERLPTSRDRLSRR